MMITQLKTRSGTNYTQLSWTPPRLLPDHYKLTIVCKHKCNNKEYLRSTLKIFSNESVVRVDYLPPWSECDNTLTAVYNPSSLDPGILRTISTAIDSKSYCFQLVSL